MSKNKIILLVLSFLMTSIWNTYAQVATVSGVVQDKSGETIIGANVLVKGTANGAITDLNGKFTISGVSTNGTLVVTYIGYVSKEIAVKIKQILSLHSKKIAVRWKRSLLSVIRQ